MSESTTVRQAMDAAAAAQRANLPQEAAQHLARALELHEATGEPIPGAAPFILAKLHLEARRLPEAEAVLRKALAKRPGDFDLNNIMGVVLKQRGRLDEALRHLDAAQKVNPKNVSPYVNKGNVYLALGRGREAAAMFSQAVRMAPKNGEYHRLLGVALRRAGEFAAAGRELERGLQLAPNDLTCYLDMSWFLEESGRAQESEALLARALERFGPEPRLVRHRTKVLRRHSKHREAVQWLDSLAKAGSRDPGVFLELAHTLKIFGPEKANAAFAHALKLSPDNPEILAAAADNLQRTRGPEEARNIQAAYQLAMRRLALGGDYGETSQSLFYILMRCADYESAARLGDFTRLGEYWSAKGSLTALHGMLAQARTPEDRRNLVAWHRRSVADAEEQAARTPLAPAETLLEAPAVQRAKIRIGFMSSDLRNHPVAYFVAPFIDNYDRSKFELYCYSWCTKQPDQVQQRIAGQVDAFRLAPEINPRDAAALIAADHLDMLFELGGATDMNKIETMAWRPAPRQASWLGYPHSAGYAAIDRILVDPYIEPKDPALLLEKPFRVAHSWVAFENLGFGQPPEINPVTPQERTGSLTFGTMNNPYKYNPELLSVWARILVAAPGSRLLFVRPEGATPAFRANLERFFAARGVEASRLAYVPVRGAHLPHYNDIDVALDTFPQTGGTTTCETLWMGVPTVSLAGEAFFERLSCSNLSNAGLGELVAFNVDDYVATALRVAEDTAWRAELRRTARERIRSHPLGDAALFTRDFEDAATAWMDEPRP